MRNGVQKAVSTVVEALRKLSKPVTTPEEIAQVREGEREGGLNFIYSSCTSFCVITFSFCLLSGCYNIC